MARGFIMINCLEKQRQKKAVLLDWITAKAKHSWIFSTLLVVWEFWELIEHILLPIAAATFTALWFWGK